MHGVGVKPKAQADTKTEAFATAAASESLAGKEQPEGVAQFDGKLSRAGNDVPVPEENVPRTGGGDGDEAAAGMGQIVHDMPKDGKVETVMNANGESAHHDAPAPVDAK